MACNKPLIAWSYWKPHENKYAKPIFLKQTIGVHPDDEKILWNGRLYDVRLELPCGQCIGCRLEYSRQWAVRCVLEAMQHKDNYFITLTYNDENIQELKRQSAHITLPDPDIGEVDEFYETNYTLDPDHLTKFMKDLRAHFQYHKDYNGIRFFACGEYGDKGNRPHFHIIAFGLPLDDIYFWKDPKFKGCKPYLRSPTLEKLWKKGFVCIGDVSYKSCAYVARYVMKKQTGKNADIAYKDRNLVAPFVRMSRMPGIARDYYDSDRDKIYSYQHLNILGADGKPIKTPPPSYYDRCLRVDDPELYKNIKDKRKESALLAEEKRKLRTDVSKEVYLTNREESFKLKVSRLTRCL